MYRETDLFLREKKQQPDNAEVIQIAERVYCRVQGLGFWIPYGEVLNEYQKKMSTYSPAITRIRFATALASQNKNEPSADPMSTSKEKQRKTKGTQTAKAKKKLPLPEQDDTFFFIAGYTSGGAPYGVTWEEMGLEPWEEIE